MECRGAGYRAGTRPGTACPAVTASASPSISVSFSFERHLGEQLIDRADHRSPSAPRSGGVRASRACRRQPRPRRRATDGDSSAAASTRECDPVVQPIGIHRPFPSSTVSRPQSQESTPAGPASIRSCSVHKQLTSGRTEFGASSCRTLENCLFCEITKAVSTRYISVACVVNSRSHHVLVSDQDIIQRRGGECEAGWSGDRISRSAVLAAAARARGAVGLRGLGELHPGPADRARPGCHERCSPASSTPC